MVDERGGVVSGLHGDGCGEGLGSDDRTVATKMPMGRLNRSPGPTAVAAGFTPGTRDLPRLRLQSTNAHGRSAART